MVRMLLQFSVCPPDCAWQSERSACAEGRTVSSCSCPVGDTSSRVGATPATNRKLVPRSTTSYSDTPGSILIWLGSDEAMSGAGVHSPLSSFWLLFPTALSATGSEEPPAIANPTPPPKTISSSSSNSNPAFRLKPHGPFPYHHQQQAPFLLLSPSAFLLVLIRNVFAP